MGCYKVYLWQIRFLWYLLNLTLFGQQMFLNVGSFEHFFLSHFFFHKGFFFLLPINGKNKIHLCHQKFLMILLWDQI